MLYSMLYSYYTIVLYYPRAFFFFFFFFFVFKPDFQPFVGLGQGGASYAPRQPTAARGQRNIENTVSISSNTGVTHHTPPYHPAAKPTLPPTGRVLF